MVKMRRYSYLLVVVLLLFSGCFANRRKENKVVKLPPVVVKASPNEQLVYPGPVTFDMSAYDIAHYLKYKYFLSTSQIDRAYDELEALYYDYPVTDFARQLAVIAYFLKKYEDAAEYGSRYLASRPDLQVLKIVADSYYHIGNYEKAEKYFKKLYNVDPSDPLIILRLVQINLRKKKLNDALKLLEKVKNRKPVLYYYIKARIMVLKGNRQEAIKSLETLRKINPDYLPGIKDLAMLYATSGQVDRAINLLKSSLKKHPDWVEIRFLLARLYQLSRKGEAARKELQEIKKDLKNSSDWTLDFAIAFSYLNDGKIDRAIEILENLSRKYPKNSVIKLYLALGYAGRGEYERALDLLNSIEKDRSILPAVLYLKASILYQVGEKEESVKLLKKLIEISPSPGAYLLLAEVYQGMHRFDREIQLLKEALKKYPDNTSLLYKLGVAYDFKGDYDSSLKYMKKILSVDPMNPDALNYIGYYYADRGIKLDEAEKMIKKALSVRPNDPYIMDSLGWVYYKKGDLKRARRLIERAVYLLKAPEPEIYEHLGDIYFKLKDYRKAEEFYQMAFRNYEKEDRQERVLEKLKKVKSLLDGQQ